jgi:hypothetical protein
VFGDVLDFFGFDLNVKVAFLAITKFLGAGSLGLIATHGAGEFPA